MTEVSRKHVKKTRKYDPVKKFGVKKKRWEVEHEEIVSLETRLQDLESVRDHAILGDIEEVAEAVRENEKVWKLEKKKNRQSMEGIQKE